MTGKAYKRVCCILVRWAPLQIWWAEAVAWRLRHRCHCRCMLLSGRTVLRSPHDEVPKAFNAALLAFVEEQLPTRSAQLAAAA